MSYRYYFSCLCALVIMVNAHSQSMSEIKNSNNYVWGEGTGVTVEDAEKAALAQMSRSIAVTIYNKTIDTEENGNSLQKSILQSVSTAHLRNVQIKILEDNPNARVFCFILRHEIKKMFQLREEKILDLVEMGKKAEGRLQIDDALRCYYWALVLAKSNVEPITVSFNNEKGYAVTLLPIKIKSVLQHIKADVVEGEVHGKGLNAIIRFTYCDNPVSSLQFNYNDGQSIVGPVVIRDGIGEVDLVSIPDNEKIFITYETRFKNELDPLNIELNSIYSTGGLPIIPSSIEIPIRIRGKAVKKGKTSYDKESEIMSAEPVKIKTPIKMKNVQQSDLLLDAVINVEAAIKKKNPAAVYSHFTPEGYQIFTRLLGIGQIEILGKPNYEFIDADGYLIGRSTHIKVKFKGGRSFMENLVYRFNPQSKKIESVAFALTKQAENDIMNSAAAWPEISRWAILNFMEDYQTAFALKRLDYISNIFSDDALIITGTVLKKMKDTDQLFDANKMIDLDTKTKNVTYSRHTKKEYIQRLDRIFKEREFVHLSFENNVTNIINLPSVVNRGAAFGIEIKQRYISTGYSDEGYLTLIFDTRGKNPIIHVRLWQPNKTGMMGLQEFISKFTN